MPANRFDVLDPRTGKVDFVLDCADAAQVKAKADELRARQPGWQALGIDGRVAVLRRWSEALNDHGKAIGDADAHDTGNAGNVSVQDSFLTFAAAPAESDSFGASGLGGKRTGIQRYLKRQALLHNMARPVCLTEPRRMAAE